MWCVIVADQVLENIHMPKLTVTDHNTRQIILQHKASRDQSQQKYNRCKQQVHEKLYAEEFILKQLLAFSLFAVSF